IEDRIILLVPVIKMKKRPSNVHQYKILIVNDEPDITLTLKNGPEENGFSVDAFNDPKAALSKFKAAYYDLSLVDINMADLNGGSYTKK
ncbi:MAG: response regulator, partial [Candidatus Nitrosopolaris sp.]